MTRVIFLLMLLQASSISAGEGCLLSGQNPLDQKQVSLDLGDDNNDSDFDENGLGKHNPSLKKNGSLSFSYHPVQLLAVETTKPQQIRAPPFLPKEIRNSIYPI